MATRSNTGFYPDDLHMMSRHAISFQSGAVNSTSEMIPMGGYFAAGMFVPANSCMVSSSPGITQAGSSSGSALLFDSVPGLKHDAGFAVEWSAEEQYKLDEGLEKFKDETNILKYIKIAAMLRDKTVRDVALRCRWMQRKRRKPEEHLKGKKTNSWKDVQVQSSSKINIPSALPQTMNAYSPMMNHVNQNKCMASKGINSPAMHLLEQNAQAFNQISSNLSAYKLQDNIDLFCCTRDNITTVLNYMREMPGIMSQMPPLPVSINEDLANSILPGGTNVRPRTAQSMMQLKQEPSYGCEPSM